MIFTEQCLDALFDNDFTGYAFIFVPICVLALSLRLMRRLPPSIKIISSLLLTASAFNFCLVAPIDWSWRDGLGPDAVTTHGEQAISRFMEGFVPTALISATLLCMGLFICTLPWFFQKDTTP